MCSIKRVQSFFATEIDSTSCLEKNSKNIPQILPLQKAILTAMNLEDITLPAYCLSRYKEEIRKALLIRRVEETLLHLYAEGKLNGTVHTCVGQEFTGVFVNKYLQESDHIVSNHRGHGHYLARFEDIKGLIGEVMGKKSGCCGGIGGSQHLVNKNYLSNGIQGGMTPIAAGIALDLKRKEQGAVSVAFIGDGTLGEGIIYETFNIASKWELPLVVVLEHNSYAQSTSWEQTFSGDIQQRIEGFGLKYFSANTWELDKLDQKVDSAITFARSRQMPVFIHVDTYRLNSHSKGDDNRDTKEIDDFVQKDILTSIIANYYEEIKSDDQLILTNIKTIIDGFHLEENLRSYSSKNIRNKATTVSDRQVAPKGARYNEEIYDALKKSMSTHKSMILIGEDIQYSSEYTPKPYGGAFKVTRDLSYLFPDRVFNTPISEAAITGIASGYALRSNQAMVEIMFGDFSTLILDQILQHASKFEIMFSGQVTCPLIIRTPMGGKRGYGPTHSQSLEKHFFGIPNLGVVALNHRVSPDVIYEAIQEHYSSPFIVIENKVLYTIQTDIAQTAGFTYIYTNTLFPSLTISPKGESPQLTIICYGETLLETEKAIYDVFVEDEVLCEIVCPTIISPVDLTAVSESVTRTGKLLIIEEGNGEAAWGSEIVAKLLETGVSIKKLKRFYNDSIIPSSLEAELALLPTKKNIVNSIRQIIPR